MELIAKEDMKLVTKATDQGEIIIGGPSSWSSHHVNDWLFCPYYGATASKGFKTNRAMEIGTAVHAALAQHYAKRMYRERGQDPDKIAPWDAAVIEEHKSFGVLTLSEALHFGEQAWSYLVDNDNIFGEVIGVEYEMKYDLQNGKFYTQKADLITEFDGLVFIIDHKTKAAFSRFKYHGQFQMIGYNALGKHIWGDKFGGVLVNEFVVGDSTFASQYTPICSETIINNHWNRVRLSWLHRETYQHAKLEYIPKAPLNADNTPCRWCREKEACYPR